MLLDPKPFLGDFFAQHSIRKHKLTKQPLVLRFATSSIQHCVVLILNGHLPLKLPLDSFLLLQAERNSFAHQVNERVTMYVVLLTI